MDGDVRGETDTVGQAVAGGASQAASPVRGGFFGVACGLEHGFRAGAEPQRREQEGPLVPLAAAEPRERMIRPNKGSKRPPDIWPELWQSMSQPARRRAIEKYERKPSKQQGHDVGAAVVAGGA